VKNSVDLGKAFTHLFEDAEWITKMVIGSLIALVPILNFALVGYEVRVMRNVAKGEQHPMPSWNDFGDLFTEGMWLGLARIVYSLPVLVLILPMFFIFFFLRLLSIMRGRAHLHRVLTSKPSSLLFNAIFRILSWFGWQPLRRAWCFRPFMWRYRSFPVLAPYSFSH
jgi:hypothetical protein